MSQLLKFFTVLHIKKYWVARKNIMFMGRPASYPASLTSFYKVKIAGRERFFKCKITEVIKTEKHACGNIEPYEPTLE